MTNCRAGQRSTKFLFQRLSFPAFRTFTLIGLWVCTASFGLLTVFTFVASMYPVDCRVLLRSFHNFERCSLGTYREMITLISRHRSYTQAIHSYLMRSILFFATAMFLPQIWSMAWRRWEEKLTVRQFQHTFKLITSASLWNSLQYIWSANWRRDSLIKFIKLRNWPILFVMIMGMFSLASTFLSAVIMNDRWGPFSARIFYIVGDGADEYPVQQVFATKVATGRNTLTFDALNHTEYQSPTGDEHVIPFLLRNEMQQLWQGTLPAVVARTSVDCSSNGTPLSEVAIDPDIFTLSSTNNSKLPQFDVTFREKSLGSIEPTPAVWLANAEQSTLDISIFEGRGSIDVILLGTNVGIEGALRMTPAAINPSAIISMVDILACRVHVQFEVSICWQEIDRNMTCSPDTDQGPLQSLMSKEALDIVVAAPFQMVPPSGSALPALSIQYWGNKTVRIKDWDDNDTRRLLNYKDSTLPQEHFINTVVPTTQNAIIQAILKSADTYRRQKVRLRGYFVTSSPALQVFLIVAMCIITLIATFTASRPRFRTMEEPTLLRLIAISDQAGLDRDYDPDESRKWDLSMEERQVQCKVTGLRDLRRRKIVFCEPEEDTTDTRPKSTEYDQIALMNIVSPTSPQLANMDEVDEGLSARRSTSITL